MNIIPYQAWHARQIELQVTQLSEQRFLRNEYFDTLKTAGPAITGEYQGRIIACAGIALAGHMGTLWAMVSQDAKPHFIRMHKVGLRLLDSCGLQRIEATVAASFAPGCRWLELLKFNCEGEMPLYGIDGTTHLRYSRLWR